MKLIPLWNITLDNFTAVVHKIGKQVQEFIIDGLSPTEEIQNLVNAFLLINIFKAIAYVLENLDSIMVLMSSIDGQADGTN